MEDILNILSSQDNIKYLLILFVSILLLLLLFSYKKRRNYKKFINHKIKTFQDIFDVSKEAILIISDKNEILYANSIMINLLNLEEKYLHTTLVVPDIKIQRDWNKLDKLIKENISIVNEIQKFEKSIFLPNGAKKEILVNLYMRNSYMDDRHKNICTTILIADLRSKNNKTELAFSNKLTNLPNQAQAINDLNSLFAKLHLGKRKIALLLLDIDNFSTLRSIVGYEQTDIILKKFADYLVMLSKELNFSVYHTIHNNFLLLMPEVGSKEDVLYIASSIKNRLITFYQMGNSNLHLTASAGIAIYPDNSTTLNLLDNAYKALEKAEKNGHGRIEFYHTDEKKHNYDEMKLYNDVHKALSKNEFEMYYQPIVDAQTQEVVAAEALIRWNHSEYGMIRPDIFISIMEKTGLIVELGKYVLKEVLMQQKRWQDFKFKQIEVAINISMLELETGKFVENVAQQLEEYKVPAHVIKFEVTEGIAMISEEKTSRQLEELNKMGLDISLDDFGTGYTSFSYLKKIPASYLKIDRSIIINVAQNIEDQRITKAIIDLGHTLGMQIIVEGIEDKKMYEMVKSLGCDYIQGYYFSKPLPVFEFQKLLRR